MNPIDGETPRTGGGAGSGDPEPSGSDPTRTCREVAALCDRLACEPEDEEALAGLERCAVSLGLRPEPVTVTNPRVSIIVLCRDQLAFTQRCLWAVRRTVKPDEAELILVDNGSSDGTGDWAAAEGDLRLIRNRENLGFGPANNQAAKQARGEFLLFLNNDTEPQFGWLERLLAAADSDPAIGAVGARLVTPDGVLLEAGATLNSDGSCTNRGRGSYAGNHAYEAVLNVPYASACGLLVRKQAFDAVGGFDPRYAPAYYEDVDLCLGLRKAGYRVVVEPDACIVHAESVTAKAVTGSEKNRVRLQEMARRKFLDKWQEGVPQAADDPLTGVREAILPEPIRVAILSPYHGPDCLWGESLISDNLREALEWRPDVGQVQVFSYATCDELAAFRPDLLFSFTAWRYPLQDIAPVTLFYIVNFTHEYMPAGTFLNAEDALRMEADIYAANSGQLVDHLGQHKPAHLLHMGANPRVHRRRETTEKYRSQVTYLGSYNPGTKGQEVFDRYILPATGFDLALYGDMWERSPEAYRRLWRGRLPTGDIPRLYSSVDMAIGFGARSQADADMINNRVFEVLSCGALLFSDRVAAIEELFGEAVVFTDGYEDLREKLNHYASCPQERERLTREGMARIQAAHTYDHRARQIVAMYADYQKSKGRL